MSLAFVPHHQRAKGPPNQATIQKMLDENNQLIQAIIDYQNKGNPNEVMQYQHMLHRNLVYLATIADSNQNNQALLPALGQSQSGQNQMASHGNAMTGPMPQGQMTRPIGPMMGPRPNMPGPGNQSPAGQGSVQGVTGMALSKLMQLRPQVAMGDRNTPSPGGQNPAQRPPMPSMPQSNGNSMSSQPQQPMTGQSHYPHGQQQQIMMLPGQNIPNQGNMNTPTSGSNVQMNPNNQPNTQHTQQPMSPQQQPMPQPGGNQAANQMMGQRGQMPPPQHPPGPPFRRSPNQGPQSYGGHQANYGQGQGQMSAPVGASYAGSQPQYGPQGQNTGPQQSYNTGMGNNGGNNNTSNNTPYQSTPTGSSQTGSHVMSSQGGSAQGHMMASGSQASHVTNQQGHIPAQGSGQQGHVTGQQNHMTGQQGHMTGQQGHMTNQQGGQVTGYNQAQQPTSSQGAPFGQQGPSQPSSQAPGPQSTGNYPQGAAQYVSQPFGGQNQSQNMQGAPQSQNFNGPPSNMPQQGGPGQQYGNVGSYAPGQQGSTPGSQGSTQVPGYGPYGQRSPMPSGPTSQMRPQMPGSQMPSNPGGNNQMHPTPSGLNNQLPGAPPSGQPSGQSGYGNYNQNQY